MKQANNIRITPGSMPQFVQNRTCRVLITATKKLFEDPEVKKNYLEWKKQRKELSKT